MCRGYEDKAAVVFNIVNPTKIFVFFPLFSDFYILERRFSSFLSPPLRKLQWQNSIWFFSHPYFPRANQTIFLPFSLSFFQEKKQNKMAQRVSLGTEGCRVETHGLSTSEMNGLQGGVVGQQNGRIIVELHQGGQKALRAENLSMAHSFSASVFLMNAAALFTSLMYLATVVVNPVLGTVCFKLTLILHALHYASLVSNMGVFSVSLSGVNAVAATASGQLLLWILAFLFLGQSCYFLVGALGCYSIIAMSKVHSVAFKSALGGIPGAGMVAMWLNNVETGLQKAEDLMDEYDMRVANGSLPANKPNPPAHYFEIAGVCLELFAGVQQLFQAVLSATQSFVMLAICWRYLGYRYRLPRNRVVRTVFSMQFFLKQLYCQF